MNFKPIIIIAGEPNMSLKFSKNYQEYKFKSPIILFVQKNSNKQSKVLRENIKFNQIYENQIYSKKVKLSKFNLIDVEYTQSKAFQKISSNSNKYIKKCFDIGLKIIKKGISNKFINGPISKKYFLKNKYIGMTEYLAEKKNKKYAMVIFNKKLSVSPITTTNH